MYEHVKTSCKHIPPSEQPLQFQSGYYLNKPRIYPLIYVYIKWELYSFAWIAIGLRKERRNIAGNFSIILLEISNLFP